jgi:tetratricopeptide (TPR) repeat protein
VLKRPRSTTADPAPRPHAPPAPLPLTHPALIAAALVAAACIVVSVSFRIYDPDLWQHLAVGRAIWALHHVPTTQLWTWPTWGAPDVNASWGFRALIWPVWHAWGVPGLFGWRWLTTLAAFGLLWATARRMGARGFTPLVVLVLCATIYRQRSQVRPETLVAVLLALELWILETRRRAPGPSERGPDHAFWLIPIAWAWANVHISYYVGFVLLGFHLIGTLPLGAAKRGPQAKAEWTAWRRLLLATVLAAAVSFVNPWGWRALWQPFEYFFYWRHEPIFQTIGELDPVVWANNLRNGLALVLVAWPVLLLWRASRFGLDRVEALTLAFFAALGLSSQRFLGTFALVAAPYLARDLHDAWQSTRLAGAMRPAWARALLASAACVGFSLPEWTRADTPLAIAMDDVQYPIRACDYIEGNGIRGRGFNPFSAGGYILYRFWPDRTRLPFMDIHQAGTRLDRTLYAYAIGNPPYWRELDARHRFEYAVLFRHQYPRENLIDGLDADSTWAHVFMDDAAVVYVRRGGAFEALVKRDAYAVMPGGSGTINALGAASEKDSVLRRRVRAELEREIRGSPWHAHAASLLANVALIEQRPEEASGLLHEALRVNPLTPKAWERLGLIALDANRPREALGLFEKERRVQGRSVSLAIMTASAWRALGDSGRARTAWREALRFDPANQTARDSLAALGGAP